MIKIIIPFVLLAPVCAQALDGQDAAAGGGGAVAVTATAYATKKAIDARRRSNAKKIVTAEAKKWKWDAARQEREIKALLKRGLK